MKTPPPQPNLTEPHSCGGHVPSWMPAWLYNRLPTGVLRAASIPLGGMPTLAGMASALTLGTASLGLTLGGLGYTGLQRAGVLGRNAPGFLEAAGNVWARATGGDVTQENGYTAAETARRARRAHGHNGHRAAPPGSIEDQLSAAMQGSRNAWNQKPTWAHDIQGLPGLAQRGLRDLQGRMSGYWASVQDRARTPGTMSQGVDSRYGEGLRRIDQEALRAVQGARAQLQQHFGQYADAGARGREFDATIRELRDIAHSSRQMVQEQKKTQDATRDMASNIIARTLAYDAENTALSVLRMRGSSGE